MVVLVKHSHAADWEQAWGTATSRFTDDIGELVTHLMFWPPLKAQMDPVRRCNSIFLSSPS